jgi:hypothetical protein
MIPNKNKSRYFWVCAAITFLNASVSTGFSIARLLGPEGGEVALYAASRSVAILLVVFALLWIRSRAAMAAMAFTVGLVQLFDTGIGFLAHQLGKTLGPLLFAVATLVSVGFLLGEMGKCCQGENKAS